MSTLTKDQGFEYATKLWYRHPEGCPRCGGEQRCPCRNCAPRNAGRVMWRWDESGEAISCGYCGFTMHADGWMDLDWQRFYKKPRRREEFRP